MPFYLLSLSAIFCAVALMLLGNGLLNSLLTLAGAARDFSPQTLGWIMSGYFVGFVLGIWVITPLVRRVGHIRAFAFCAALAALTVLLHLLLPHPVVWLVLRVVYGMALVSLYTLVESWLNRVAPTASRGRIFATYMAINLGSLALAQQLLRLDTPEAPTLFVIAACLLILSLMPVALTRLQQPDNLQTPGLNLKLINQSAPLALMTALLSGLTLGAFWGLTPVYLNSLALDTHAIAWVMTATIAGGALFQWPLGYYSDNHDRRHLIGWVSGMAALLALLLLLVSTPPWIYLLMGLWGGLCFTLYPLAVAHLMDHLEADHLLSGISGLLLVHGTGAAFGPVLAGYWLQLQGSQVLPAYFVLPLLLLLIYQLLRQRSSSEPPLEEPSTSFNPMLRTSPQVLEMVADEQKPTHQKQE